VENESDNLYLSTEKNQFFVRGNGFFYWSQLKHFAQDISPETDVYIGRTSRWEKAKNIPGLCRSSNKKKANTFFPSFLGKFMIAIGVIWLLFSLNLETSVRTDSRWIGDIHVPSQLVHNLEKSENKRMHIILALSAIIIGTMLYISTSILGSGKSSSIHIKSSEQLKKCPFCAEMILKDAIICRYCKSNIERNINA
jgi:hypothetical protein